MRSFTSVLATSRAKYTLLLSCSLLSLATLCGCQKESGPPPPLERNRLMIRMFDNMERQNFKVAAEQAIKYRQLSDNSYLNQLEALIQVNRAIAESSRLLELGNLEAAADRIEISKRKYPFEATLVVAAKDLQTLAEIHREIRKFKAADTADEMTRALRKIEQLFELRKDRTMAQRVHELQMRIADRVLYEKRIARTDLLLEALTPRKMPDQSLAETFTAQIYIENVLSLH